jgi:hypothetical protein
LLAKRPGHLIYLCGQEHCFREQARSHRSCICCVTARRLDDGGSPTQVAQGVFLFRFGGNDSTPDQIHLLLREEGVEGFQQTGVIDGFAKQIQHLQVQQIGHVIHVGVA